MNNDPIFCEDILLWISQFLEPHQRFQMSRVNKWFQQITNTKLSHTMVFSVFSNSFNVEIYSKKQTLNKFLKSYKALLPWINSNNVGLKFLTVEELLKLFHNSSNFSINMLILNKSFIDITSFKQLKVILNSLKFTILSLKNFNTTIPDGTLKICSKFPSLQYLQVWNSTFSSNLDLKKTYFNNIIFKNVCSNVSADICMPLCLKKFHLNLKLLEYNNQAHIKFRMNQCEYIKEL
jgi:hypothetical protein